MQALVIIYGWLSMITPGLRVAFSNNSFCMTFPIGSWKRGLFVLNSYVLRFSIVGLRFQTLYSSIVFAATLLACCLEPRQIMDAEINERFHTSVIRNRTSVMPKQCVSGCVGLRIVRSTASAAVANVQRHVEGFGCRSIPTPQTKPPSCAKCPPISIS